MKRNRVSTLLLAGMLVFSLAMLVFAYSQNLMAKKQRELSIRLKEELVEMEKIAKQNQEEAMMQRLLADQRQAMAQKQLEECMRNQKIK